jgi:5-methylcytosine-specific restriction protein A
MWPGHIAERLGIEEVPGLVAPFVSNGDTTDVIWFECVGEVLGVPYPGERVAAMRLLVEHVGEQWDEDLCSSSLTPSGGGGNLKVESFRRLFAGLRNRGYIGSTSPGTKRDPNWAWDEVILAFDLYLDVGDARPDHHRVIELSNTLQGLGIHPDDTRGAAFRTPASVSRKLADIHTSAPGYEGKLTHAGRLDRKVWEVFGDSTDAAREAAAAIRAGALAAPPPADDEEDYETVEGLVVYRVHRHRERDRGLRRAKVSQVRTRLGRLLCEACDVDLSERFGEAGESAYECHHLVPLFVTGQRVSRLEDVALLCPTCHRVAHRIRPWPSLADLRSIAGSR